MHRLVIPLLAVVAGLIFGITSDSHSSVAGTWTATHSGETGGEGSGIGLARKDLIYTFPDAFPAQVCKSNGAGASCYSYRNNLSCSKLINDGMVCGGSAGHSCGNREFLNNDGICVTKNEQPNCGGPTGDTPQPAPANPVIVSTGEKIQTEEDWTSGGVDPLRFVRNYSAFAVTAFAPNYSRLGPRWRSNF